MGVLGDVNAFNTRNAALSKVQSHVRKLQRHVASRLRSKVQTMLTELGDLMDELEVKHDLYMETISSVEREDPAYKPLGEALENAQDIFLQVAGKANELLEAPVKPAEVTPDLNIATADAKRVGADYQNVGQNIARAMSMQRRPMHMYSGDPRTHQMFFSLFENKIANKMVDEDDKVMELLHHLEGAALSCVDIVFQSPSEYTYAQVKQMLDEKFGQREAIGEAMISDALRGKKVRTAVEYREFSEELNKLHNNLTKLDYMQQVDSIRFSQALLSRCHTTFADKWKEHALKYKDKNGSYPSFEKTVEYVVLKAKHKGDPVLGEDSTRDSKLLDSIQARVNHVNFQPSHGESDAVAGANSTGNTPQTCHCNLSSSKTDPTTSQDAKPDNCPLCNQPHSLLRCDTYKTKQVKERLEIVKNAKLCYNCLGRRHYARTCKKPPCNWENCGRKHHHSLHTDINASTNMITCNYVKSFCIDRILLPIVKVFVNGYPTYALIDPGSTHTLIAERLVKTLELQGPEFNVNMNTVNQPNQPTVTKLVTVTVKGVDLSNSFVLSSVLAVPLIPACNPEIAPADLGKFKHLHGIPWHGASQADVTLLIGQDNTHLLTPTEIRAGNVGEPTAMLYPLGWGIQGPITGNLITDRVNVNLCHLTNAPPPPSEIFEDVTNLWKIETENEFTIAWSEDDNTVYKFWEQNTRIVDGRYEIPIPFKHDVVNFPNNRVYAQGRLRSTLKGLRLKGKFDSYKAEIDLMLKEGYAEKVPVDQLNRNDGMVFYLPHFPVYHPDKPLKTRPVHDAAAQFQGISLNNQCYSGPNLTNPLASILTRFREFLEAIGSDVTAMYLQVLIPMAQRDVLRFLWIDDDGNLIELRMTRHIFGGIWCAASTTYAIRRAAQEAAASLAVELAIRRDMYVDDLLHSVPPPEHAARFALAVRNAVLPRHFSHTKFVGHPASTMALIPVEHRQAGDREIYTDVSTKTLGIRWLVGRDAFAYGKRLSMPPDPITKRDMLSLVASIYDPLGLIAPVIILGKLLLQKATALKIGWKEPVPDNIVKPWKAWWEMLDDLADLYFPRCLLGELYSVDSLELHHFCDASLKAYGTTTYARIVCPETGKIHTCLLRAKGRVAPMKPMTVPRLELCAAEQAVKLDLEVQDALRIKVTGSFFYSDSTIVLTYIKSTHLRCKLFVANRRSFITAHSKPENWSHIATDINPGDVISRGCTVKDLPELWHTGPAFLRLPRDQWPADTTEVLPDEHTDLELAKETQVHNVQVTPLHPLDRLLQYFEHDLYKLQAATAWWMRLPRRAAGITPAHPDRLSVAELDSALQILIKHTQHTHFEAEINLLLKDKPVARSSKLAGLNPALKNGILVVGGRLKHADIDPHVKHPIILPKTAELSKAILLYHHNRGHHGSEWVLTQVKQKYHIFSARQVLKSLRTNCSKCNECFNKCESQLMADLPPERVTFKRFPFSFTGIDLFGIFYVKVGRATCKRYGVMFTCFQTRAVHIEVVHSLDADSFILALLRFQARRGTPVKCRSDRGTNIVGAANEMKKAWLNADLNKITSHARRHNMDWEFTTPTDSPSGGIWERQIRSIRKALVGVLTPSVHLTDEKLLTVMTQAENLVNSRPITRVSDDPEHGALTPNHLLLLHSNSPDDILGYDADSILSKNWTEVNTLVDAFWRRWSTEYLTQLYGRQKWDEDRPNLKIGDMVMIADPNLPRGAWKKGIVERLIQGDDDKVRSVALRTDRTRYERPVKKLVKLGLTALEK